MTIWPKTFVEWIDGDTAYLSVPFTWDLPAAYQRAVWLAASGYKVRAGGPASVLDAKIFPAGSRRARSRRCCCCREEGRDELAQDK